ncbi:basic phospholipase A2 Sms-N6-like [Carcharodon carcharias]|uniref:basic phospholipase A2 Sms-N6-like n=1 Tax=Carcharodon carcharias TaxID=13397 RepID=UPI001B7EC6AB|nr:basic phospholipase A2 Sms-N6-like [Carcharodon carcharias]
MGRARRSLLLRLFLLLQLMPLPHCRDLPADDGSPRRHRVSRRSVLDIAFVLWCYRSRYQFSIYSVNGYGCYCGKGGDGVPLDDFDSCCFNHDCCYEVTLLASCAKGTNVYFKPNYSLCKLGRAECPEGLDPCSSDLCLCDKQFGECLTIATFRDQYSNYQQKFCTEPKRKCPQEEKIDMEGETRR